MNLRDYGFFILASGFIMIGISMFIEMFYVWLAVIGGFIVVFGGFVESYGKYKQPKVQQQ